MPGCLTVRVPALDGAQPPTAFGAMKANVLQKQNVSLQSSLQSARREIEDTETRLKAATATLEARDSALSTYERQWLQLEEQLSLLLASVQADTLGDDSSAQPLLQLGTAVAPLSKDSPIDESLTARCTRMQELTRKLVAAAGGGGGGEGAALAAKLQAERAPLSAELAKSQDVCTQLKDRLASATSRLDAANDQLDKTTKDLNREKLKAATRPATPPPAAPTPTTPSATPTAGSSDAPGSGGNGAVSGVATAAATAAAAASAAAEAEMRTEMEAAQRLSEERLKELQANDVELRRLRAAAQEAGMRPVSDEALQRHPEYKRAQGQLREYHERVQQSEARLLKMRNDAAQISNLRHSEHNEFEEYRTKQALQASDEAKERAEALASAHSERRAIELQLAQISVQQKRDAESIRDLREQLRLKGGDAARAATESARLKEVNKSHEAEVARARSAEEAAAEKAKALELQLTSLQPPADAAAVEPAEKRWQEALVKLGTAEQRVVTAQRDLEAQQSAQDALMGEIEAISEAYEEVQTKADELRSTVALKEEALGRAKSDKLRADQAASMLRKEHETMQQKVATLGKQSDAVSTLRSSFDAQQRKTAEAAAKKDDEIRAHAGLIEGQKSKLNEAQRLAQQAMEATKQAQEVAKASKEREEKEAAKAAADRAEVKRLTAERDTLSRKLTRAGKDVHESKSKSGGGGGGDNDVVLESFRRKVKCSLCMVNDKDAIISNCMHAFCRDCIQKRLDVRNRKCPACALKFEYQSVKDLFLTN